MCFLLFSGTAKLFYKVAAPFYNSTSNIQRFQFLHILANTFYGLFLFFFLLEYPQPVHSKGDQSWVFTGRTDAEAETPVLWPPHAKS